MPLQEDSVLDFAESIMNDRPTEQAPTANEAVVETAVQVEAPIATQIENEKPIEFVVSEPTVEALQTAPAEQPVTTNNADIDFDKRFNEKIAQDLGISDFETLKSRLAQIADLEVKANSNVYKSEQGRIFDEFVSKGVPIDTIASIAFKDLKGADDLQVLDYQMQLKYPTSTAEQREAYLVETYKQSDEFLDREKLSGSFKMKQDAEIARQEFEGLRATALQSPIEKQNAEFEAREASRVSAWETKLTKQAVSEFNSLDRKVKINFSFDGKPNEQEAIIKVPISAKDKAEMESFLNENVKHWSNATADANGIAFAKEVLQNKYIVSNLDKIIQSAVNNATSYVVEKQKAYLHNYQPPRNNQSMPQTSGGTTDQSVIDYAMDALNS